MITVQPGLDLSEKSPLDVIDVLTPDSRLEPTLKYNFPAHFQLVQFTVIEEKKIGISSQPSTILEGRLLIDEFLGIFQHPNTKIYKLTIIFVTPPTDETYRVFNGFISNIRKSKPDFKISTHTLELIFEPESSDSDSPVLNSENKIFDETWKLLDEGLEALKVIGSGVNLKELSDTEKFKKLNRFECDTLIKGEVNVADLCHLEKISVIFERFSIEQFVELANKFKNCDIPRGSRFQITSNAKVLVDEQITGPIVQKQESENVTHLVYPPNTDENFLDATITQFPEKTVFKGELMSKHVEAKVEPSRCEKCCCGECCPQECCVCCQMCMPWFLCCFICCQP